MQISVLSNEQEPSMHMLLGKGLGELYIVIKELGFV